MKFFELLLRRKKNVFEPTNIGILFKTQVGTLKYIYQILKEKNPKFLTDESEAEYEKFTLALKKLNLEHNVQDIR